MEGRPESNASFGGDNYRLTIKVPHLGCHPDNYGLLCEAAYLSLTTFLSSPESTIHQLLRGFGGVGGAPMKFLGEAEPRRH